MNELIKDLSIKANEVWLNDLVLLDQLMDKEIPQPCDRQDIYLQKFAELIVRECVGVVEGGIFLHDQAPDAIFAKACSKAIKRHFGVEE